MLKAYNDGSRNISRARRSLKKPFCFSTHYSDTHNRAAPLRHNYANSDVSGNTRDYTLRDTRSRRVDIKRNADTHCGKCEKKVGR